MTIVSWGGYKNKYSWSSSINILPLCCSYSLEHLDNIEKLDLSNNRLVWVGSGVFRGLSRLRQLYLHNNRLSVVQQGSLDLLPGLEAREEMTAVCVSSSCPSVSLIFCPCAQVLNLSNNNISRIDGEALAPLHSLAILALEGNNLHHLKFKTFVSLHTTATHITLTGIQKSSVLHTKFGSCVK